MLLILNNLAEGLVTKIIECIWTILRKRKKEKSKMQGKKWKMRG